MDTHQVVKELQDERKIIVAAIDSLQRLAAGRRRIALDSLLRKDSQ